MDSKPSGSYFCSLDFFSSKAVLSDNSFEGDNHGYMIAVLRPEFMSPDFN